jgi:hypothetical protein
MNVRSVRNCAAGIALALAAAVFSSSVNSVVSAADSPASGTAKPEKPPKIDLNTASAKKLQELPGIGEAFSKKIISARPLRTLKELSKLGIPAPTIEKLRPLVTLSIKRPGGKLKPPKKGLVWVNTDSKIYHKEDSPWYGNTKEGKWMTEADAVKAGFKPTE